MDAEKDIQIERREGDEMIRATLMDGQVRVMMCETTRMVQRAADIHHSTPVCTAAMGRLMTATSMLGVMMKGENESVTVNIKGGGPMGTVVAVANHGDLKVCADDPQVELPLREDGKLNVGAAIGKDGYMTVIKDLGLREPYIGQIELRSPMFSDISREMTFAPKEELLEDWFRGMDLKVLERMPLQYNCGCSRYRMEKALISLGRRELQNIIDEDTGAELGCHFCHSKYAFSTQELKELLARASRD